MENVEDVYPLAPMQEMMLLHTLSVLHRDALFSQFVFDFRGTFDTDRFRESWRALIDRHTALRSMFLWEDLKRPMQIVRKAVTLPFTCTDWSDLSPNAQASQLQAFCDDDRQLGFDPSRAPLMRVAIFKLGDDHHYLVWSSHHLVMDRWCIGTLFRELSNLMSTETPEHGLARLEPPASYRHYAKWLHDQKLESDSAAARKGLGG